MYLRNLLHALPPLPLPHDCLVRAGKELVWILRNGLNVLGDIGMIEFQLVNDFVILIIQFVIALLSSPVIKTELP